MICEVVGGYMAHSLAIMTDAAHLLSDTGAYLISIFALFLAERQATAAFSYGFARAEVLGVRVLAAALSGAAAATCRSDWCALHGGARSSV